MNRIIKFRVWDLSKNSFFNSYKGEGLSFSHCSDEFMENFGCYDLGQCINFGFVVQQFTGFRDRQGLEIYEGDIIKYADSHYLVEFFNGQWVGVHYDNDCRTYLEFYEFELGVVIGNKMQNPELL